MRVLCRLVSGVLAVLAALALFGAAPACRALEPANRPLDRCRLACVAKAKQACSEDECERGCEFILDRLVEREGETVIACVAKHPRRCNDVVWADCAAWVGPHADGGPPGPPPPQEIEE